MKVIEKITWNWSPACMESNGDKIDCYSATCESAKIGEKDVLKIEQTPIGEGNKSFCDIHFKEGSMKRVFNPSTIDYIISDACSPFFMQDCGNEKCVHNMVNTCVKKEINNECTKLG